MLDAQVPAVVRVPCVGGVTRGIDARDARLEVLVGEDAVVDPQPGRLGELGAGGDANADDDDVGDLDSAVGEDDCLDGLGSPQLCDADAEAQVDAVFGVQVAEDPTDPIAEHPLQRHRRRVHEDDACAHLAGGRRHLGADPAASDHRDAAGAPDGVAQSGSVGDGSEVVDAVEVGAGKREPPWGRAGGEDRGVEVDARAAGQLDAANAEVEVLGVVVDQFDVVGGVEADGMDVRGVRVLLAAQHRLGQRRALVGCAGFVADEDDATVEAGLACRLGCLGAGEAGPDHCKRRAAGHG